MARAGPQGQKGKIVMKLFYIVDDFMDSVTDISRSRAMYYLGYLLGLLWKFAVGLGIGCAVQFVYYFIRCFFRYGF